MFSLQSSMFQICHQSYKLVWLFWFCIALSYSCLVESKECGYRKESLMTGVIFSVFDFLDGCYLNWFGNA